MDVIHDGRRPDAPRRGRTERDVKEVCMRIATWNIGSMSKRSGEVVDAVLRRRVDVCCLQEVRWRVGSARWLGRRGERYTFFWQGSDDGSGGVRILVAEKWAGHVISVSRESSRVWW